MWNGCRSRIAVEGWTGRKRHYKCRVCGADFVHDGQQLPEKLRTCPDTAACLTRQEARDKEWAQATAHFIAEI